MTDQLKEGDTLAGIGRRLIEDWRRDADKSEKSAGALPSIATIPRQELRLTASVLRACANELNAALRACAEARPSTEQGWQPIETAPKDGTYVLVAMLSDQPDNEKVYRVSQAAFNGLGWYEKSGESCHWRTHWIPMPQKRQPAPPRAEALAPKKE